MAFLSVTQGDTGMILSTHPPHPVLSGLDSVALTRLVRQYYFGDESEAELIKAYGLDCEPGKLSKILPLIQAQWLCPYCQCPMVRKILPKTGILRMGKLFCFSCSHIKSPQCPCAGCKKSRPIPQQPVPENERVAAYIASVYVGHPLFAASDLSLKEVLYLLTLLTSSVVSPEDGVVGPIATDQLLVPNHPPDFLWDYLSEKGLITLSHCTDPSAFTIVDNKIQKVDYRAARWKIFLESFDVSLLELIKRIESATWPPKWRCEFKALQLEIAVLECLAFATHLADERHFSIVDLTQCLQTQFLALLAHYSVSQCFYLMQDAARQVSDDRVKNTIHSREAGIHFTKYMSQAVHERPDAKNITRPAAVPVSCLSDTFHNDFLDIGAASFTAVPKQKRAGKASPGNGLEQVNSR